MYVLLPAERSTEQTGGQSELVEELRRQNEYLREENRRKDHLLAAALERIPAIEPPQEPSESAEPRSAEPTPTEGTGEPQRAAERPWWQFWR